MSAAAIPSLGASVYSWVKQGGSHLWAEGQGRAWPSPWSGPGNGGQAVSSLGEGQGGEGLWLWEAGGVSSPMTEAGVGTGARGLCQGLWPEVLLH